MLLANGRREVAKFMIFQAGFLQQSDFFLVHVFFGLSDYSCYCAGLTESENSVGDCKWCSVQIYC